MKIYDILIKDVYTDEKRSETMQCDETADIRDIHKQAMKVIKVAEDIECIRTNNQLVYTIDRGFLA
tara:strand:- start:161 stop:358 length:198 start_codon:yes stop_codon:yes gene_type:complete